MVCDYCRKEHEEDADRCKWMNLSASLTYDFRQISHRHSSTQYVYVLEGTLNNERWFYVGATARLRQRVWSHVSGALNGTAIDVDNIDRIIKVEHDSITSSPSSKTREKERETAFQVAIDYETTNILGGK